MPKGIYCKLELLVDVKLYNSLSYFLSTVAVRRKYLDAVSVSRQWTLR